MAYFCFSFSQADTLPCDGLYFLSAKELASIRKDFNHSSHYSSVIQHGSGVESQEQYGSCWIFSGSSHYVDRIRSATNQKVNISEDFLVAHSLFEHVERVLNNTNKKLSQGGLYTEFLDLVKRVGVVPESSWKPRVPFTESPHIDRLMMFIKTRISQFAEAAAKQKSKAQRELLKTEARKDIHALIRSYTGDLPTRVDYKDMKLTPKQFRNYVLPNDVRPIEYARPIAEGAKPYSRTNKYNIIERGRKCEDILKLIAESIEKNISLVINTEMSEAFIDNETGIMSIAGFYAPEWFQVPTAKTRIKNGSRGGLHAMEIVGVDVVKGEVRKLKLKNSWGRDVGSKGYYHMYADYFCTFAEGVYLF